jgi:hypothetical protein
MPIVSSIVTLALKLISTQAPGHWSA